MNRTVMSLLHANSYTSNAEFSFYNRTWQVVLINLLTLEINNNDTLRNFKAYFDWVFLWLVDFVCIFSITSLGDPLQTVCMDLWLHSKRLWPWNIRHWKNEIIKLELYYFFLSTCSPIRTYSSSFGSQTPIM